MKRDRPSVLFVMTTMGRAGAERALLNLLETFPEGEFDLFLFALFPHGELFQELPRRVTVLNRKVSGVSPLSWHGRFLLGAQLLRAACRSGALRRALGFYASLRRGAHPLPRGTALEKAMRRLLADGALPPGRAFDCAVAYLEGPATWYTAEKVRASRKAAFVHVEYGKAGYRRALDEGAYGSFGRVYCVSREVRESFLHAYPEYAEKTELCYNTLGRARILRLAREEEAFPALWSGFRILTVGRLHPMKGCDIAVEAARLLREQGRRFCWVVLGEGPERARLTRQIRRSGLQDMFLLPGARQNPYPWFRAADLYVCASRYEGKSLVVEEAQFLGCPVVTLPCTGVEEQVEDGASGLIVSGSAPELAAAIASLIDDAQRRAAFGRRAAEKPLPPDEGSDRLRAFLKG